MDGQFILHQKPRVTHNMSAVPRALGGRAHGASVNIRKCHPKISPSQRCHGSETTPGRRQFVRWHATRRIRMRIKHMSTGLMR